MDSYSAFHRLGAWVRESTGVRGAEGVLGRGALGVSDRFLEFPMHDENYKFRQQASHLTRPRPGMSQGAHTISAPSFTSQRYLTFP